MMSKLVFFDIDGTLAHPGDSPTPATVAAIRQLRTNGHKAFLSTGRTMDSIPGPVAEIGFDGGIFSSGAVVMCGDQIIAQHFMPDDLVQRIWQFSFANLRSFLWKQQMEDSIARMVLICCLRLILPVSVMK